MHITSAEQVRRAYRDELWYRGNLRYLIRRARPHAQLSLYDWIRGWKAANPDHPGPLCATTHRRLGKSTLSAVIVWETAIRRPSTVKIGCGTFKQTREIYRPVLQKVLSECPAKLRPEHIGEVVTIRNPRWEDKHAVSTISMVGCNIEHGDRLRGTECDLAVLDEVRDIDDVSYVQDDILWPMFQGMPEPLLLQFTTMPKTLAHDYIQDILRRARREDRARTFRVADLARPPDVPPAPEENLDWTPAQERLALSGGITKDSSTWRREFLCEEVADESALIVPEFQRVKGDWRQGGIVWSGEDYCEAHRGRPRRLRGYMGADFGWEDFTAVLHGFLDFESQILVIEHEIVRNHVTPKEIAVLVNLQETLAFREEYIRRGIRRYCDNDPLTIAALRYDHRLFVEPADKYDREEAIAGLRTKVLEKKLRIHERCKELRYQLENGIWDDDRKHFIRSKALGHCDALAALIYLVRMVNWRENPGFQPKGPGPDVHVPPWAQPKAGPAEGGAVTRYHTHRKNPFDP